MTKIEDIRFGYIQAPQGRPKLVAAVRGTDGSQGFGVGWARLPDELSYGRAALSALSDILVGARVDAFDLAAKCQDHVYDAGLGRAATVMEMALFDLEGQVVGRPVHRMIGSGRSSLPAYAISSEEKTYTAPSQFEELAIQFKEAGYKGAKFHLKGDIEFDIKACRAIRAAVGPEFVLMHDPMGRYSREDALRVGRVMGELAFARYEDPISPLDIEGYGWLTPRLDVPVMVNELLHWTTRDVAAAAGKERIQGIRLDLGRSGTIGGLRYALVAAARGIELDVAALVPRGGLELALHLACASPATRWFEDHKCGDLASLPGVAPGFDITKGTALLGNGPGLGLSIDWPEFERHCTWVS
jgi:L-alanine-DL-glutamate epimerase-like enolase superfamily enzyme